MGPGDHARAHFLWLQLHARRATMQPRTTWLCFYSMNTPLRKISMPLNRWIMAAGQISTIADNRKREGIARMVQGGSGLEMVQGARQAASVQKELLAAIDRRFDDLGRSDLLAQQEMAREELVELGVPDAADMGDHARLREDTEKLLVDVSFKIQEMGRRTLEFELPEWIAEEIRIA